jgi:hypothetical protein
MGNRLFIFALVGALATACVAAGSARSALRVGVAEDALKGHHDGGGAFLSQLTGNGLSVVRVTVYWDAAQPTTIMEKAALDRALPVAASRGVTVILSIVPLRSTSISSTPGGADLFAAYCALVARTYPLIKHFLVGNEPNQPRFWRPQFDASGARVAASNYFQVLSRSYDALKAVDAGINVLGLGLSPRGNNRASASTNPSTAPVTFIRDLGVAYKASARALPIMDFAAFHPYPNPSAAAESPEKGLAWPNAGVPNIDRLQQAFWDAFHGTGQPLFAEGTGGGGLRWIFDESGWQTDTTHAIGYYGDENTQTVGEDVQAQFYAQVVARYACDARVAMLLFFHWFDEGDRDRMQTGLVRADGTPKAATAVVRNAIAGGCRGAATAWTHTTKVVGAGVTWTRSGGLMLKAEEDFTYRASILRLVGASRKARGTVVRTLSGSGRAYWKTVPRTWALRLAPGRYTYSVSIRSVMNPERESVFTGGSFTRSFVRR